MPVPNPQTCYLLHPAYDFRGFFRFFVLQLITFDLARLVGIDYGKKRTGIAVTDPAQMIATPLTTVQAHETVNFLTDYVGREEVEAFIVGYAKTLRNQDSEAMQYIRPFVNKLRKHFPDIPVKMIDERFTSKIAEQAMITGGMKKSQRQVKGNVDKISASLILQSYLEQSDNF